MILRKLGHQGYRYLIIFVSYLLFFIWRSYDATLSGDGVLSVVLLTLGGINIISNPPFSTLLLYTIPYILTIYIYSDFMRNDFIISYTYIFPRMGEKGRWLRNTSLCMLGSISALFLILEMTAMFTGTVFGLSAVDMDVDIVKMLLSILLLNCTTMYCVILFQNILSLRLGSPISFLLTTVIYIISLYIPFFVPELSSIWRLLLPVNQMFILHSNRMIINTTVGLLGNPIDNFPIWFSLFFLILLAALIYVVSKHMLNNSDLSNFIKEDE